MCNFPEIQERHQLTSELVDTLWSLEQEGFIRIMKKSVCYSHKNSTLFVHRCQIYFRIATSIYLISVPFMVKMFRATLHFCLLTPVSAVD